MTGKDEADNPGEQRRSGGIAFAVRINLFAIGLSTLWVALNTVVLPDRVDEVAPASLRGSALGLITFLGIGLAAIVQPVAGLVSDQSNLPDRRKPFIIGPTLFAVLAIAVLWWAPRFAWLLVGYLVLQLLMNFAQAAFQGLIPDLVPEGQRGPASGVKTAFDIAGTATGLLVAAVAALLGYGNGVVLLILASVLAISAMSVLVAVPRAKPVETLENGTLRLSRFTPSGLVRSFREAPPGFNRAVLTRFLFLLALYPLQRFILFYLEDRFGIEDPAGLVAAAILVGIVAGAGAAAAAGALADSVGHARVEQAGIIISFLGLVGLVVAFELWMVGVAGLALMIGAGAFQAANWATLSEAVPDQEGAAYLGLSNLATAGASALVGLLGPLVDVANALIPAGTYAIIFSIAALCAVVAYLPTRGQDVPSGAQKKRSRGARPAHEAS